jgi:hypothetical protein
MDMLPNNFNNKYIETKEKYLELKKYIIIQKGGTEKIGIIQVKSLKPDDLYVIKFNCFIENVVNKKLITKYKYNFEKAYANFIINIYNNRSNEVEDYKLFLAYIKNNCNLDIKSIFDSNAYQIDKITIKTESANNKNLYNYVIAYRYKKENKTSHIHCQILNTNIIYKTAQNIDTIVLIYKILGLETGMFWGINPKVYGIFANDSNSIECFASPFNHTLDNYYSVLPIDKVYGSQGNFFNCFNSAKYTTYIMNPPFTEYIILKMFDEIYLKLDSGIKCCMYIYIPMWSDLNDVFYEKINRKYRIFKHNLLANTSYVYNYIQEQNIIASFDLTLFLVTNDYKEEYYDNYKKMIKILEIE